MEKKRIFTRKPYDKFLYKWSPDESINTNKLKLDYGTSLGCNATPFSQGEDWITTYVYNYSMIDGQQHHSAYVECDYVK